MTEQEWMVCEDPHKMLNCFETAGWRFCPDPRKLTLLNEVWLSKACGDERYTMGCLRDGTPLGECQATETNITRNYKKVAAAILRDIIGNPWKLISLPLDMECGACDGTGGWASSAGKRGGPGGQMVTTCRRCEGEGRLCSWLTPTVRALAEAAYECRAVAKCGRCGEPPFRVQNCPDCKGTGTIDAGHLDHDRLLVLADALEEAGADPAGEVQQHLRDPNLIHYRGCHILDLFLGEK